MTAVLTTQDGNVLVFDVEVGTASASSVSAAWCKIRRRKAEKRAREFLKARDSILAQSRPFR